MINPDEKHLAPADLYQIGSMTSSPRHPQGHFLTLQSLPVIQVNAEEGTGAKA
jgi:hypothetical protein